MEDQTQRQSHSTLGNIKSALKGVKGAGDTIRGTFNESVDSAFHQRDGELKNKAIKDQGIAEMEKTDAHFNKNKGLGSNASATQPIGDPVAQEPVPQTHGNSLHQGANVGSATGGLTHDHQPTADPVIREQVDQTHAVESNQGAVPGRVTGGLARNTQLPDGTSTGAGAHSGGVGNMQSNIPQEGLGGEPGGSTGRF